MLAKQWQANKGQAKRREPKETLEKDAERLSLGLARVSAWALQQSLHNAHMRAAQLRASHAQEGWLYDLLPTDLVQGNESLGVIFRNLVELDRQKALCRQELSELAGDQHWGHGVWLPGCRQTYLPASLTVSAAGMLIPVTKMLYELRR